MLTRRALIALACTLLALVGRASSLPSPQVRVNRPGQVAAPAARASQDVQVATNMPGMDYRSFDLPSADPAACQQACENEAQCRAWTNWDVVDLLPPYTVVGLKHSQNQKVKTFVWRDGRTYDPLVGCPDGFDRKDGGDRGASSGTGYYWCEKRR
jgi:hypothetical protein